MTCQKHILFYLFIYIYKCQESEEVVHVQNGEPIEFHAKELEKLQKLEKLEKLGKLEKLEEIKKGEGRPHRRVSQICWIR